MTEDESTSLWQWYPVAINDGSDSSSVRWRFLGDRRFTEPFYESTLVSLPSDSRSSRLTPVDALDQFKRYDCLEPSAFVFHASRCGSTLLTQLLAMLTRCIVISEAPVIDSSLRLGCREGASDGSQEIFKGVLRALGQRRFADEQHMFVKLDSWHIHSLPLIRRAFPDTPCFFIYRNPAEILSSHRRHRGLQMVPGLLAPETIGLELGDADPADLDGYCLRVLTSLFRSASQHAQTSGLLLIHYSQLPALTWTQFVQAFSISLNADEIRQMRERSTRHSKNPSDPFTIVSERDPKTDRPRAALPEDLETCYQALEQHRLSQRCW